MASILTPGYLRWDGTKYVLDQDVEIVGPTGSPGPQGPTGSQGTPGIGVGASATGDLSGIYPSPISVVGLTGVSGIVSFGELVTTPTITQTTTTGSSGQPLTIKGQGAVTTGGNVVIQSGIGSTPGLINFLIGNTTKAVIDTNGTLRIGPLATTGTTVDGILWGAQSTASLYSYSAGNNQHALVSNGGGSEASIRVYNNSGVGTAATALKMFAAGTGGPFTGWGGNSVLEMGGASTSAMLISKTLGDGTGRATLGRIFQSGAFAWGDVANNDTSTEAQAGLTGPVINLGAATGSFTSTANQALNFNIAGSHHIQGHADIRFDVGTSLVGYFDGSIVGGNIPLRIGNAATSNITYLNSTQPSSASMIFANGTASATAIFNSQANNTRSIISSINTSSGTATGITLQASGTAHSITAFQNNGVIEQVGPNTTALVFSRIQHDETGRVITGRIFQSGAWVVGDNVINDTSSEAQAGLTGSLINVSPITGGSLTSAGTQMTLFNNAGQAHLQGGTDVRFDVATTLAGYFDNNLNLRFGPSASTGTTIIGNSVPLTGVNYLYGYNASGSIFGTVISGNTATRAGFEAVNNGSGTTLGVGIGIYGASTGHAVPQYAGNGIVEQFGSATSAMIFTKKLGDGTGLAATGRIFQSGAWVIGDNTQNDTSTEAQAGLTGPLLNLSQTTGGSLSTVANQALVYNTGGNLNLQGNAGHNFIVGTTTTASVVANKFVSNLGRRVKVTTTTISYAVLVTDEVVSVGTIGAPINVTLPTSPTTGDRYTVKDANGSAGANNITVIGNGNNIDAAANSVISVNYGSVTVVYNGTKWITV